MRASLTLLMVLAAATTLSAGWRGSLFRGDIADLLASDNPQMKRIVSDFDIACVGDARMISRGESIKLNGVRIGPYDFPAKPKGSGEPFCYIAHIETKATFIDRAGDAAPLSRATDVREVVTSVSLLPQLPDKCFIQRPDQCE